MAEVVWEFAPSDVIASAYFPYEQCLLKLAMEDGLSVEHNIHEQPSCIGMIEKSFERLPRRCWLGSRQQRIDDGMCFVKKRYIRCNTLKERKSFWKYWKNLPLPSFQFGYGGEFLKAVGEKGYQTLAFAGDSMAIQLSQRLVCNMMRLGANVEIFGDFFSMSTGAAAVIAENSIAPTNLTVTMFRVPSGIGWYKNVPKYSKLPGIEKECGDYNITCQAQFANNYIIKKTLQEFQRFSNSKKWSKVLHVFILPIIVKEAWEYRPLGEALLLVAKLLKRHGSRLLVLSPFAQHFPGHPWGEYVNVTSRAERTRAMKQDNISVDSNFIRLEEMPSTSQAIKYATCRPHQASPGAQFPDSYQFLKAMEQLNIDWRSHFDWLDVTKWSVPWHDLHPESGSTGWVLDCTHYAFQPLMYDAVWMELADYAKQNL